MTTNRVSAVLTDKEKDEALQIIASLKAKLPFLISLSAEERKKRSMGPKSVDYVNMNLAATKSFPGLIPSNINLVEFEKDVTLFNQMISISLELATLQQQVQDTIFVVGSEAMQIADMTYGYFKAGQKTDQAVKVAVNDIAQRFKGQGSRKRPDKSI